MGHSQGQTTEIEGSARALRAVQGVGERRFSWLGRGTWVGSKQADPRGGGPQRRGEEAEPCGGALGAGIPQPPPMEASVQIFKSEQAGGEGAAAENV